MKPSPVLTVFDDTFPLLGAGLCWMVEFGEQSPGLLRWRREGSSFSERDDGFGDAHIGGSDSLRWRLRGGLGTAASQAFLRAEGRSE